MDAAANDKASLVATGANENQMIKTILHRLVAVPVVYDLAQRLAGAAEVEKRVTPVFTAHIQAGAKVLDIGGGTGLNLSYISAPCNYLCLDNDPQKLQGFQAKHPAQEAVLGDATQLMFDDASFDVALMSLVSHHLTDEQLRLAFAEIARVLKPDGCFLFLDATWDPRRWSSRVLWRIDRGANPRPYEELRAQTKHSFEIIEEVHWAVYHHYVCWTLKAR